MTAARLDLALLGRPLARQGRTELPLPPEAPLWLTAFVACHAEPVTREEVLACLYPEVEEGAARNRLRNLLHRVRQGPWGAALNADAAGLAWAGGVDVRAFRQACAAADWAAALQLYAGPLLDGARPASLAGFELWLDDEREDLQAAWLEALAGQAARLEGAGRHAEALATLERLLEHSPYAEEAVQAALRCAAGLGRPDELERVYGRFQAQLRRELGLEPGAATSRLHAELRAQLARVAPATPAPEPAAPRLAGPALGPLFGRQAELDGLLDQLHQPACRLLTLTGPGGAGKTRLAQEALQRLGEGGARALFVPLAAATRAAELPGALAAALGLTLSGAQPPEAQLISALQAGQTLLVLDNLEQLQVGEPRAALLALLTALLDGAAGLQLLVTSRLRLGLAAEWVAPLGGLDYPQGASLDQAARSGAVRLLVERGGRARPGFALQPGNLAGLLRLCQLTEGLPLALELAAAWLGTFEPAELAEELAGDPDLVESDAPDRPERHRSLAAVFDSSWRLLAPAEQRVLGALSVFRGGFERAAALAVTGASLRSLLTLADHSMLRRDRAGRLSLHEVIRQYAGQQLARDAALDTQVRAAHASWYGALVAQAEPQLRGPQQTEWLDRLQTEHDNLRAALDWSQAHGEAGPALDLATGLHWFWYVRGHLREGHARLRAAAERPGAPAGRLAEALGAAGGLARDLGQYAEASELLNRALDLARQAALPAAEARALHGLGLLLRERGELEPAAAHFGAALALLRAAPAPDRWALASTLNDLGVTRAHQHDPAGARPLFEESLALKQGLGDRQGVAYALGNLANLLDPGPEYRRLTEQSLAIKRELGDRQGSANSLFNLADQHIADGELEVGRARLREALELFWQLGRQRGVAAALTEFAKLAATEGQPARCLHLAGAADALLTALGVPAQGFGNSLVEDARRQCGAASEAQYRQGQAAPLGAAVALALSGAEPPPAPA